MPETLHRCEHTRTFGSTVRGMIFARTGSLGRRRRSWRNLRRGKSAMSTGSQSRQVAMVTDLSHARKNQTITIIPITTARLFNCRNSRWWILCLVLWSVTNEELNTGQMQSPKHVTQMVRTASLPCAVQSAPSQYEQQIKQLKPPQIHQIYLCKRF